MSVTELKCMPKFREADESGLVGVRGYMNFFQDIASHEIYVMGKGNNVIPEKYGVSWIYTKYKIKIVKAADFSKELLLESWMDKIKNHFLVTQGMRISRDGETFAEGRLESCLIDLEKNKLTRTPAIEMEEEIETAQMLTVGPFSRMPKNIENMAYVYTHQVRYTDLDKSHHMTNLRYVDLALNVFDADFYHQHRILEFEIHFVGQSYEGDRIDVYKGEDENGCYIYGNKPDGTKVVQVRMKIEPAEAQEH